MTAGKDAISRLALNHELCYLLLPILESLVVDAEFSDNGHKTAALASQADGFPLELGREYAVGLQLWNDHVDETRFLPSYLPVKRLRFDPRVTSSPLF